MGVICVVGGGERKREREERERRGVERTCMETSGNHTCPSLVIRIIPKFE